MARGLAAVLWTAVRLWRHPRRDRESILIYRDLELQRLVRHAYHNVPFYRKLFEKHGLVPDDVRGVEDLHLLPIISKQDMRRAPVDDLLATGVARERLVCNRTSGSTGEPFTIRRTHLEERLIHLIFLRAQMSCGLRLSDVRAAVSQPHRVGRLDRAAARLGVLRKHSVDCRQSPEEIARVLNHISPDVITGYPSALTSVAPHIASGRYRRVQPRLVRVGGETVTDGMRLQLRESFNAPVRSIYGAHELGIIAWDCPSEHGLHIGDDTVVVEILRDGRPVGIGESGEVVATALHSYAMPFIRYRLGDIAVRGAESCDCGAPFGTLSSVTGRTTDNLWLPDGKRVHSIHLAATIQLEGSDWIQRLQLVQKRRDRIVLTVVPLRDPTAEETERLRALSARQFAPAQFELEIVDEIPLGPGGKLHWFRSEVGRGEADLGEASDHPDAVARPERDQP